MTAATDPAAAGALSRLASHPLPLWIAFVLVHLWLGLFGLYGPGMPFGDITLVYYQWAQQAVVHGYVVGLDGPFVYPIAALLPIVASYAFGPELYASTWLGLVLLLDLAGLAVLTDWGRARGRIVYGWWWTGFLLLLGPVAVGRVDSITVPIALAGALLLVRRPALASALLALGAWIKIWPAAIIAAAFVALRSRLLVAVGAAAATAGILLLGFLAGGRSSLLSFVTGQTGRGLQVEAPVTTPWLWRAWSGAGDTTIYYDTGILTYQVDGPGDDRIAALVTPVLVLVALAVAVLGWLAVRRGADGTTVLPVLALAVVVALIAFNKVGSPQFVTWLTVPVLLGMITHRAGAGVSFRFPALLSLGIALATQIIYPYFYGALLNPELWMMLLITARNLAWFVLLGWALLHLVRFARAPRPIPDDAALASV